MKLWKEKLFKVLKVEVRNLKNQRMWRNLPLWWLTRQHHVTTKKKEDCQQCARFSHKPFSGVRGVLSGRPFNSWETPNTTVVLKLWLKPRACHHQLGAANYCRKRVLRNDFFIPISTNTTTIAHIKLQQWDSRHPMIFVLTTRYHWMSLTFQQMHCLFLVAFCPLWCGSQNGTSYKEKYVTKDVRIRPNLSRASMWSIPVTTKLVNVSPGYECGATPQGKCEGTEVAKCPFSSSSGCGAAIVPLT